MQVLRSPRTLWAATSSAVAKSKRRISQLKKAISLAEDEVPLHSNDLAYAYAKAGRIEETKKILLKQLELQDLGRGSSVVIAGIYANIGEKKKAFEWLFRAIETIRLI